MIRAVTFDLWDTLVVDDSDEQNRRALGMRSKKDERRFLLWQALSAHHAVSLDTVRLAYDVIDAAFNTTWHDQFVTWTIRERLDILLRGMKFPLPAAAFDAVVKAHEEMEIWFPPDLIPGVHDAVRELKKCYRLAVISDAIVTPGRELRRLLSLYDLAQYFDAFLFSDEIGHSKPHPDVFSKAARALRVEVAEIVHVGDREHNDVRGPQAAGAKAVLFTAVRAAPSEGSRADAICHTHADLPQVIATLAREIG